MGGWSVLAAAVVLAVGATDGATRDDSYNLSAASGRFQCAILATYGSEYRKELVPEITRLARVGVGYAREGARQLKGSADAAKRAAPDSLEAFYLEMPGDFLVGILFNSANMQVDNLIYATVPHEAMESIPAYKVRIGQFATEEFARRACATQR